MTRQARLLTVNIVHRIHPGYFHDTAIDKQPVDGPVELTASGLAGDRQLDPHHGGSDKAVYAYAMKTPIGGPPSSAGPSFPGCSGRTSAPKTSTSAARSSERSGGPRRIHQARVRDSSSRARSTAL